MGADRDACSAAPSRRTVLTLALGLTLGLPLLDVAAAQDADPKAARPREGDRLVFASGSRKGRVIAPADAPPGEPPLTAYPMDPVTSVVRDGSRLNQVLLARLEPEELGEETRGRAAAGIVAYSAVCTHTGCDSWEWQPASKTITCPCHFSVFDLKDSARVLDGPAPRRLPALPLRVVDGVLAAAGGFSGRVGFQEGGG